MERGGIEAAVGTTDSPRWRVGIAGIAIESSTFSQHRTSLIDFSVHRAASLLARYSWIDPTTPAGDANGMRTWCHGVEWVPLLHARALPGGPVMSEDYLTLRDEILERTSAAVPLDGMLLDIHGAMSVVDLFDAEGDLISHIRKIVGPHVLLSASMDLHGNVSRRLAAACDLMTCYRMAPHEDASETVERAARNLVSRLRSGGKPAKAWVQIPVLLPGEKTSTRLEPARGLYGRLPDIEASDGILDAAIWVGYAWGDEPRSQAAVVVTGDDEAAVLVAANELAGAYWAVRKDFKFVAPTGSFSECLTEALQSQRRPFVISDSGDNPTAGGAGDASHCLRELVTTPQLVAGSTTAVYAAIFDPPAVQAAISAGLGAMVTVQLGGHIDTLTPPVEMTAEVTAIEINDSENIQVVALRLGGLTVLVTSRRKQFDKISSWTALGVDPRDADVVIVKLGYLEPEIYSLAADWRLALTPGGVDQDLQRQEYAHLKRPLYPFDPSMAAPSLNAELL